MEPGRRRQLPAIAFAVVVLVTSLLPVPESAGERVPALLGLGLDKWVHAAGYAVLTALLAWGRDVREAGPVAVVAVVVIAFGVGVELLQELVPSRGAEAADVAANAGGAVAAAVGWLLVRGSNED